MPIDPQSSERFAAAFAKAMAKPPRRPFWSAQRVYDLAHALLHEEVKALRVAGLTLSKDGEFGVRREPEGISLSLRFDPSPHSSNQDQAIASLSVESPRGPMLAWTMAKHWAMGEERFVESIVQDALAAMAAVEGAHCRRHGIPVPAAVLALHERAALDEPALRAGAAGGARRGAL